MMNRHLLSASVLVALLCSCGKHSEQPVAQQPASSSANDTATPAQPAQPAPAASAPGSTPARQVAAQPSAPAPAAGAAPVNSANTDAALATLTQAVRKYSFEQRKMPKTLQEVVSAGYVSPMPQAPPGKKFVLDTKNVQVVLQ